MHLQKIHIEPVGGVAGDMLLAAFLDLGGDEVQVAVKAVCRSLDVLALSVDVTEVQKMGERALAIAAIPPSAEHHHHHLKDIWRTIDNSSATVQAKLLAKKIFTILAEGESVAHATPVENVHLHEVGELDSIMDILGIAVAYCHLGAPEVSCAGLPSGHGEIMTSHGLLECPVPAVRAISTKRNIPLSPVALVGETITPTGMAAVATLCADPTAPLYDKNFIPGYNWKLEAFVIKGVGAGFRDHKDRPNVVRIYGQPCAK